MNYYEDTNHYVLQKFLLVVQLLSFFNEKMHLPTSLSSPAHSFWKWHPIEYKSTTSHICSWWSTTRTWYNQKKHRYQLLSAHLSYKHHQFVSVGAGYNVCSQRSCSRKLKERCTEISNQASLILSLGFMCRCQSVSKFQAFLLCFLLLVILIALKWFLMVNTSLLEKTHILFQEYITKYVYVFFHNEWFFIFLSLNFSLAYIWSIIWYYSI